MKFPHRCFAESSGLNLVFIGEAVLLNAIDVFLDLVEGEDSVNSELCPHPQKEAEVQCQNLEDCNVKEA